MYRIEVRRYQNSDAKSIAQLYYNTIHTVNAKDYTQEQIEVWAPYSSVKDYSGWQEKLEKIKPFVAVIGNQVVGFAEFEPNGHIDCFYVHHEFQGVGVGSALIKEIEKEAKDKSIARIYAEVSITAKPFFEAKGFKVVKQQTVVLRGVDLVNFVMEKYYTSVTPLSSKDIPNIVSAFKQLNWDKPSSLFKGYLKAQTSIQRGIERIGNEIHRPSGPWTKQVHIFLNFLHNNGFIQAPQPLGFDEEGREILSFVKGETSENIKSLESLISSAKLLRSYHDASQKFLNKFSLSQSWMFPCRYPQEVICHNDFAPYNLCFDGDQAIGIIDFDAAHPGPRVWDIAYALYRFAPFTNPNNEDGFGSLKEQISRARVFCDAYGLEPADKIGLADLIIERLQNLLDFLLQSASQGHKKYELNLKNGHHLKYCEDLEYIKFHKSTIQDGLEFLGEK